MKYLESSFVDYAGKQEKNLHNELKQFYCNTNKKSNRNNIIFYGPSGVGKYTQALNYIKQYSSSNLKYERKIHFNLKKHDFSFKISDIHFEVDMELIGCNAKTLWNEIYYGIEDILTTRANSHAFILCKNFHLIHSELLEIFYSYMQTKTHKNIDITYIILTEQISFLPDNILNRVNIIPVKRPTKGNYSKIIGSKIDKNLSINTISNIKDIKNNISELLFPNKKIVTEIIEMIENYESLDFLLLRDKIYEIFIYHLDLTECMWDIFKHVTIKYKFTEEELVYLLHDFYNFYKFYNNNYRPIYHVELIILKFSKLINKI